MKNYIKTIRAVVILGALMLAFTGEVFAAPEFLPNSVANITGNSAEIRAYIQNYGEPSVVWFEWSEAVSSQAPAVIGMNNYFGSGFFTAKLSNLTTGVTYSFRSAVKWRGQTFYSPVTSFVATNSTVSGAVSAQGALGTGTMYNSQTNNSSAPAVTNQTPAPSTQTQTVTQTKKVAVAPVVSVKKTVSTTETKIASNTKNTTSTQNANTNMASVFGAGDGLMPTTLVGWLILVISALVVVLLINMISEQNNKRKKKSLEHELTAGEAHA